MNADEAIENARKWPSVRRGTSVVANLLAELDRRAAAIERVRKLHRQDIDDNWPAPGHCVECLAVWPCPTIEALNEGD